MENELMLVESKTMREQMVVSVSEERMDEIFNKIKGLVLLPDCTNVTTEMVASYYEVDSALIRYHIKNHKDELDSDGLKVLKGKELKEFKEFLGVSESNLLTPEIKTSPSLTLIPRRAIMRLGMIIEKSEVAKQVRTYLLDVEGSTKVEDKLIALTQDNNNIVSLLNDKVDYLYQINNELKHNNSVIITDNEELKHNINMLIVKVDELLEQPLFRNHENSSRIYDMLMLEFLSAMEYLGVKNTYSNNYTLFNKEFENWTGIDFNNKKINKKQYWISYYGIESIKQFTVGIAQKIIVKNDNGYWVSKAGIYSNKVEWKKILNSFDNKCAYCGSEEIILAEHIVPQSSEGSTDCVHNLIPSCTICNDRKGTMDMKSWIELKRKEGMTDEQYEKIRDHWRKYHIVLDLDI